MRRRRAAAAAAQPPHSETVEDDHFSDWKHNSTENVRLLYGDSELFNGLRHRHSAKEPEPVPARRRRRRRRVRRMLGRVRARRRGATDQRRVGVAS